LLSVSLPEEGFLLPLQAPEAEQELALLLDQSNVEEPPLATVVGLAESVTVGAGVVVPLFEDAPTLPSPPQAASKDRTAIMAPSADVCHTALAGTCTIF